jgi:hypothetical protein
VGLKNTYASYQGFDGLLGETVVNKDEGARLMGTPMGNVEMMVVLANFGDPGLKLGTGLRCLQRAAYLVRRTENP